MKKRILPALLALAMVLSMLPIAVFAVDTNTVTVATDATNTSVWGSNAVTATESNGTVTIDVNMTELNKLGNNFKAYLTASSKYFTYNTDGITSETNGAQLCLPITITLGNLATGTTVSKVESVRMNGTTNMDGADQTSTSATYTNSNTVVNEWPVIAFAELTYDADTQKVSFKNESTPFQLNTAGATGSLKTWTYKITWTLSDNSKVERDVVIKLNTTKATQPLTFTNFPNTVTVMWDQQVSELGTFTVTQGTGADANKVTVSGTANYISSWEKFNPANEAEQHGWYLPICVKGAEGQKITVPGDGSTKELTFLEDGSLEIAFHVNADAANKTIEVSTTGDTGKLTYTVNYSGVTFKPAPDETVVPVPVTPTEEGNKVTADATVNETTMGDAITAAKGAPTGEKVATVTVASNDKNKTLTGGSATIAKANVTAATAADANVSIKVEVADVGSVELAPAALAKVETAIGSNTNATISVDTVDDPAEEVVPNEQVAVKTFEVNVEVNGTAMATDDWTGVTGGIKLSFYVGTSLINPKLYLVEGTTATEVPGATYDAGVITATVDHLSTYMVTQENTPTEYNITKGSETNGTFTISPASKAAEGNTVTITATPTAGYRVGSVSITTADGTVSKTKVNDTTYTFTMPAKDVTVSVTFTNVAASFTDTPEDASLFLGGQIHFTGLDASKYYLCQITKVNGTTESSVAVKLGTGAVGATSYDLDVLPLKGSSNTYRVQLWVSDTGADLASYGNAILDTTFEAAQ